LRTTLCAFSLIRKGKHEREGRETIAVVVDSIVFAKKAIIVVPS
jgi:hypothetical protein